ncbi:hypothetical protein HanRHA438_Chr06g0253441 [Helianthus annuus]|nr:hypothetical protein HanHA300_Chr06g0200451 [Helianthus annuus]KAJ0565428.1 hypothetical protein HanIR_Chr06g0262511 [Helianthus annuus]KAJ0572424.1 hypothetical protein HanHA89_Chr06g0215551 [Helianthus annuus]KAJ0910543.1 hypothetical protein HanRHA438_Chr06g0253441 [Helianthus annuus]
MVDLEQINHSPWIMLKQNHSRLDYKFSSRSGGLKQFHSYAPTNSIQFLTVFFHVTIYLNFFFIISTMVPLQHFQP